MLDSCAAYDMHLLSRLNVKFTLVSFTAQIISPEFLIVNRLKGSFLSKRKRVTIMRHFLGWRPRIKSKNDPFHCRACGWQDNEI